MPAGAANGSGQFRHRLNARPREIQRSLGAGKADVLFGTGTLFVPL